MRQAFAALVFSLALSAPVAAEPLPGYALLESTSEVRGVVVAFDGAYRVDVRDQRGFVDRVTLHDGTIITPSGRRLRAGTPVIIHGTSDGRQFVADDIETFADVDALTPVGFGDETTGWQGYDRYGCSNAPAPPIHRGPDPNTSWRAGDRC